MKIRSLLLGSVAAAGLGTAAYAADPLGETLTALGVCDALGISGLTISSDTVCLQLSGGVDYRLRYGDFRGNANVGTTYDGNVDPFIADAAANGANLDWDTRSRAWLKVVATSDTDMGAASAIFGIRQVDEWRVRNEGFSSLVNGLPGAVAGGDHTNGFMADEAYVKIGDATVLMMGLRQRGIAGSVANVGDDAPYSYLFISEKIDGGGVLIDNDDRRFGGHSIQGVADLGNGVSVALGLENIATAGDVAGASNRFLVDGGGPTGVGRDSNLQSGRTGAGNAGTAVGVISYAGEGVTAHVTGVAFGVLDGVVDSYAVHAGATGTFDIVTIRGAVGYENNWENSGFNVLHALGSAQLTFDIFKIALSGEAANFNGFTDYSVGGKLSADVVDGVTLNLDGSYFWDDSLGVSSTRVQGDISAAVTENITLTAAIGAFFGPGVVVPSGDNNLIYGRVGVGYNPGGGFTAGANLEVNDEGGWRTEVTGSKTF